MQLVIEPYVIFNFSRSENWQHLFNMSLGTLTELKEFYDIIVWFQKISTTTHRLVNGNSKGEEGLESQIFKSKVWTETGISREMERGEVSNQKTLHERGEDIFWNNTTIRKQQSSILSIAIPVANATGK